MVFLIVLGAVLVGVVLTGFVRAGDTAVALFADAYSVPIDGHSRDLVERYVTSSRRFRLMGVLGGIGFLVGYAVLNDGGTEIVGPLATGYGVGAATFEAVRRPPKGGVASLARRRLYDYVRRPFVIGLWLTAGAASAVFAMALLFGGDLDAEDAARIEVFGGRSQTETTVIGVASLAVTLLLASLARRIVRSPQPVVVASVDAAQHAIRSAGLISLVGLMFWAVTGVGSAGTALAVDPESPGWLRAMGWSLLPVVLTTSVVGFFLTVRSLPRFAPFWRPLPAPDPDPVRS